MPLPFLGLDKDVELLCWGCRVVTDAPLCRNCGKIQPPSKRDYFALLGLPVSFSLDLECLEKKYLQLQQLLHPDRFIGKSTREKRYANQQASLINQAYEALKDPIQRGIYLLKMQDRDYGERFGRTYPDQDFLMFILVEQELIESATDPESLQKSLIAHREKLVIFEEAIRRAFEDQNLETALTYLTRYQYQQKLVDKAIQRLKQIRN